MGQYTGLLSRYWKDPFIVELSPEAKLIYVYLITNESVTPSGIYEITTKTISDETGISKEKVERALEGFIRGLKLKMDKKRGLIWLINYFKHHHHGEKYCNICQSALNQYKYMGFNQLWQDFLDKYKGFFPLPETLPKPLANPSPDVDVEVKDDVDVSVDVEGKVKVENTLVELFNSTCPSFKPFTVITPKMKQKIKLRLREYPDLEWWKEVFTKVENNDFLKGNGEKGFRASLTWLIENAENPLKVYQGNYDKEKFSGIKQWLIDNEQERKGQNE